MADWTDETILIASLAAGKAFTDEKAQALAENPVALAQGATDAERIVGLAIKRLADMPVLTVTAADTYSASTLVDIAIGTLSTTGGSYVDAYTMTVARGTGSIRFKLSHSANDNASGIGEECELSITKNAVEITSWTTTGNNIQRTQDVSVVPGDVIVWRHRLLTGTIAATVAGLSITASDGYTTRSAYVSYLLEATP